MRRPPPQTEATVAAREGKTVAQLRAEHDEAVAAREAKREREQAARGIVEKARTVEQVRADRMAEEAIVADRAEWKRKGRGMKYAEWREKKERGDG